MKSPMTMSNPEIGLLAKHTCKRLVGVEKKTLVLILIVLIVLRAWLNMNNIFQTKVNGNRGSCYLKPEQCPLGRHPQS